MATASNRRPRYRRGGPGDTLPFRLQARDREIIKLVHDFRLATSRHIQLLIPGSMKKLLYRLQKLYKHQYIDRIRLSNNLPMVYALDNRGADELARMGLMERTRINWHAKNRDLAEHFVEHTLMISDVRCLLTAALRDVPEISLHSWVGEGELRHDVVIEGPQQRSIVAPIIPDGSFILERPRPGGGKPLQAHCFVEADRSTMSGRTRFFTKLKAYWTFWREGTYKETYNRSVFRVLTVTKSPERRDNLRGVAQRVSDTQDPMLGMFWFAALSDSLDNPSAILAPIWRSGGDEQQHSLLE